MLEESPEFDADYMSEKVLPVTITASAPPSMNKFWRAYVIAAKMAGIKVSAAGRKYKGYIKALVNRRGLDLDLKCALKISIEFFPPDRRRRDGDNIPKILFDSLQDAGFMADDFQVVSFGVVKRYVVKGCPFGYGSIRVRIDKANREIIEETPQTPEEFDY